jgi:bromodomain and WD repeat domain-containing protein 1/3
LVKLWSAIDGRLLTTFRGASAEITDIAINLENTMIAAGSIDRILRVWDLQNASVIAVLNAHNGMITSVNFCPNPRSDLKFVVTTSTDGSVAFWQYNQPRGQKPIFQTKPTQYHEKLRPGQAQMICASFSPGGMFLAAGSADHHVRVYIMAEDGPKRILEVESHTDTVDSIQWAHSGLKFISGSKDGTALLWRFETQQWKFDKLNMSDRLSTCPAPDSTSIDLKKGLKVTMVSWDRSDDWVVTAVNDHSIKVWNSKTSRLHKVLRGHTDELYVLESHPKDPHVLLSAGHDGQILLWDIYKGEKLASFMNTIEGQGHGGIFDAKWSPDGTMIAATDSHGHMLMFGIGSGHKLLKEMPKELFFHTDYRPLVRDANYYVLDEQTQLAPYLMPPPFLVDVDGNPYPPGMQRFVPGRENYSNEQLVPDISVGETEANSARSEIDRLIEALANRQQNAAEPNQQNNENNPPQQDEPRNRIAAPARPEIGVRDQNLGCPERLRTYVKPLKHSNLHMIKQGVYYAGVAEMDWYRREMKKRPLMINTGTPSTSALNGPPKKTGRGGRKRRPANVSPEDPSPSTSGVVNTTNMNNRTSTRNIGRPRRLVDDDDEEAISSSSESSNSDDSTAIEEDMDLSSSSSSDSDSSEYSDWIDVEDQQKLQPPKRSKRKPVERRTYSPADSEGAKKTGPKGIKKIPLLPNGEIPDEYKPPEWLSEVIPKKAPYYPQMGDEVVYFRQGHERYFEHVENKKLYQLTGKYEPWQQLELREHEFCKVIGIKYEIRPPRLCCLKLALMTDDGNMTDKHFTIKYHDIPDVLDFLVLKQTFDTAISRNWGQGDRFRCMIDDKWWIGQIESHQALQEEFPDSLFMCFKVRWDNSEYEFMSPWDMEPIDEDRLPASIGGSVSVQPEEIQAILYRPKSEEWPRGDREATCRRIVAGLEQVMTFAIADPFLTPVDLNSYPTYAYVVEYPIDLSTIKSRFENHFYRRITSAQFDVRYLATNAEKFNEKHSNIVKYARIITDLCLRILR